MSLLHIIRSRFLSLFSRSKADLDLDEELRYHLERQIEENIAAGLQPADARRAALRSFADLEQRKDECRDMRGWNLIDNAVQDFRYALRGLRKHKSFTALAVVVMALGIGVNTSVFSVVNGVLLKPLAYRDPDRIVTLTSTWKTGGKVRNVARPDFEDWRNQSTAFSAMALYRTSEAPTRAGLSAEYVHVARVSLEFFAALGIEPIAGRLFNTEEQRSGDSAVAVISYSYWQTHFSGVPVGQTSALLRVSDQVLTIVGVLPARFHFPDETEIWRPVDAADMTLPRTSLSFQALGRLKPNVKLEQAQAQITSIEQVIERQNPSSNKDRSASVTRLRDYMVGDVRLTLLLLLGAVGLVMLIACANVATLLLTKATARTREIAIRAAVGAGRGRILRQLITESLVLASLGGVVGLIVAAAGLKALIALAPADVPRLAEASIDGRVLLFTFAISVACSVLFGLVPALYAARVDLNDALKQGGARAVISGRSSRLRGSLVVAEIALSVMLLAGAGLLIRSFIALNHVELGFVPERTLLMKASLPVSGPQGDAMARQFFKRVLEQAAAVPGVAAVGATMGPPGRVESSGPVWTDHFHENASISMDDGAIYSVATPGAFAALGIPLKRGRDFDGRDSADGPMTAVINEALARKAFPGRDPIGRDIYAGFDSVKPMKIVGIVGDVRQSGPERRPDPEIYMPYEQHAGAGSTLTIVARTSVAPEAVAGPLRAVIGALSPDVPVKVTTMEAALYSEVAAPRFRTLMLGIFAALSLCLAMTGVYGVTAHVASQRSSEIGLRMAMGATSGQVARMILKQGMNLAALGMAIGFLGALGVTRLMTSVLFEVKAGDPWNYAAVALVMGAIVLAASYIPSRRAARIDPLAALRAE